MYVAGAATAAADEHQVALAHFQVEPFHRQPVAELFLQVAGRCARDVPGGARSRQQLVGLGQDGPLRIEQWPQHLHQLFAERSQ